MSVSVEQFGEDHWSTLLNAEGAARGYGGRLDPNLMRCNPDSHPEQHAMRRTRMRNYRPTVRKDGTPIPGHDSYDCLDDLQAAGLLTWDGLAPRTMLTNLGLSVVAQLMGHRIDDGAFDTFTVQVNRNLT